MAASDDDVLTLAQLARYLHLSEKTVTQLVDSGEIPGVKLGSEWRFQRAAVRDWLAAQATQAEAQLDGVADPAELPLGELLTQDGIIVDLRARDRLGVIEELAALAWRRNWLTDKPWFIGQLVEREALASTAMDAVAWRENRDVRARLSAVGAGLAVQLARGPWRAEVGGRADVLQISARDRVFDDTRRDATTATVSPRARTSLEVAPGWQVFAAYGHGLRSPEARAVALGDEAQFTTSRSAELGVSRQTSGFTASATGFGAWIENEVVFDHVAGTTLVRNATRRLGAEVAASFRATDWLGLRADATYVHARFTDSGSPVPGVPGLLGRLEARGQRGPWAAGVLASAMATVEFDLD